MFIGLAFTIDKKEDPVEKPITGLFDKESNQLNAPVIKSPIQKKQPNELSGKTSSYNYSASQHINQVHPFRKRRLL